MAKDCFTFKQFSVYQDRCAMKVGTDGTLLGAWAHAPEGRCRILDIGTGTGLIAMMMAQRYPQAEIVGVDISSEACAQARENVKYNPPYFVNSLNCPDENRTIARHSDSLSYKDLLKQVIRLLSDEGNFSLVIPTESISAIESEAAFEGLFLSRKCLIKTTPRKSPKRVLMEFHKYPSGHIDISEEVLETSPNVRSEWYSNLTKDFYL